MLFPIPISRLYNDDRYKSKLINDCGWSSSFTNFEIRSTHQIGSIVDYVMKSWSLAILSSSSIQ